MGMTGSAKPITGGLGAIPEHKQKAMMDSYANFYGIDEDRKVAKLTYTKL